MDAYMLTILVTGVQEDAIKDLFNSKRWKYERNGSAPSITEDLHNCDTGKRSKVTPRNLHQTFPLRCLEQQLQFASFEDVTGVSRYNSCERMIASSGLGAVQSNMIDKNINVHSVGNDQGLHNNQVEDLPTFVSQHSKIHAHATDLNPYPLSSESSKQYCGNSPDVSYLNICEKIETCIGVSQKQVPCCLPQEYLKTVDNGNSTCHNILGTEVNCKDLDSNAQYRQLTVTGTDNKYVEAELLNVSATNHSSMERAACGETLPVDVSLVDTDIVSISNSRPDSSIIPGYSVCSRLKESIFSTRDMAIDNCLQKYSKKWLLNDLEIMCEFIKKLSNFKFDRKLIQPKLEEIFDVLRNLLENNLMKDSVSNISLNGKPSFGEEKELKNQEFVERCCPKTYETSACDTDCKVEPKYDVEPIDNSPKASITSSNTEAKVMISMNMGVVNMNASGYFKKKLKPKEKKNLKGFGDIKGKRRMKPEILNGHETYQATFNRTDRYFLEHEVNFSDMKCAYSVINDNSDVKKTKLNGQISTDNKRISCLDEEKVKTVKYEGEKSIQKKESAKFRWTVNRNRRMHKYHRKCETVPSDLDTDFYSNTEKGFFCPDCKFIFMGKNKLILHKRLKKGYCLPDCIYCDADNQKEVFQCSKCPKCFQTKEMLERHEDKHANFLGCSFCESEFYIPKDLKLHIQTKHAETALKIYLCDLCGAKFKERKVLNAHRRFVHSDERPEVCTFCNKCFKTKSQLKNHLVTHKKASDLNLSCEICGKMFLRVSTLKDHVRRHKKEFTCFCTICNKGFYRKYGLEEHMRVHTGDKPFDCKVCGFKCALSCNLVKHMKVHQKYNAN